MTELQTKLLGSLDEYWQTIVDKLVDELYTAYPGSSGDTRMAIGAMNGDPVSLTTGGFKVLVTMPDYYEFLDEGVKGAKSTYSKSSGSPFAYTNKMPPIDAMLKFMKDRGISKLKQDSKRKNTRAARSEDLESRLRSIAFAIAKSIFNKGLEASNFYSNVINDKELLDFELRLLDEFGDFIVSIIKIENK